MNTVTTVNQEDTSNTISISYQVNKADVIEEYFGLLVIACDPANLKDQCDYTQVESDLFDKIQKFQFHTTLFRVKVPPIVPGVLLPVYTVIFSPAVLDQMDGQVYVYRNETAKQYGIEQANSLPYNLITVYQFNDAEANGMFTEDVFRQKLFEDIPVMRQQKWWPYELVSKEDIVTSYITPYFNHFGRSDIQNGIIWDILQLQGTKSTLFVHATTCFESIVDCWGYSNILMSADNVRKALPADKNTPIAIIGAGASGLLMAVQLKRLHYTQVKIFESTGDYGGKTQTYYCDTLPDSSGNKYPTVCELGACYTSPSYNKMIADLGEYLQGNRLVDFSKGDPTFRGVVTQQLAVLNYPQYVLQRAGEILNTTDKDVIQLLVFLELGYYIYLYESYMGNSRPIPAESPGNFLNDFGGKSFKQYLVENHLDALSGMLEYAYEVQGYGTLDSIPALYGLVWITPEIMIAILLDGLIDLSNKFLDSIKAKFAKYLPKIPDIPIVQAWEKGWKDMWRQIVEDLQKDNFKIVYNAEINSIKRN